MRSAGEQPIPALATLPAGGSARFGPASAAARVRQTLALAAGRGRAVPALALAALLAACAPAAGPQTGASRTVVSSASAPGVGAPMNRGRAEQGLPPLASSAALTDAAIYQARYAAERGELTHRSAGNATVMDRVKARGFRACLAAENLAAGQPDAASVTAGWLASPGHRRNIMVPGATHWGAGTAQTSDGMRYWAMVVAGPC